MKVGCGHAVQDHAVRMRENDQTPRRARAMSLSGLRSQRSVSLVPRCARLFGAYIFCSIFLFCCCFQFGLVDCMQLSGCMLTNALCRLPSRASLPSSHHKKRRSPHRRRRRGARRRLPLPPHEHTYNHPIHTYAFVLYRYALPIRTSHPCARKIIYEALGLPFMSERRRAAAC